MLTIRRAQLDHLDVDRLTRMKERLARSVSEHWPDVAGSLGPPGVAALVERAMAMCEPRGLQSEEELGRYLNVMCALGPDFEDVPRYAWTRRVLDDAALRPAARLHRLCQLVSAELARATEDTA